MSMCLFQNCSKKAQGEDLFCQEHSQHNLVRVSAPAAKKPSESIADKYPKYYKKTDGASEVDVYWVHKAFDVQDPSGAIQHASKKLLLSGVRTGGKSKYDDIKEARDTLTRWLELYKETK